MAPMPSEKTIRAAKPMCPVGPHKRPEAGEIHDTDYCLRPLSFNSEDDIWMCPKHGAVQTPQNLVHLRRVAGA